MCNSKGLIITELYYTSINWYKLEKDNNPSANFSNNNFPSSPAELEKSKVHIIVEILEYVPNTILNKTIINKTTGNVTVSSFASGEKLGEKKAPHDTYIQIIDGTAEISINEIKYKLKTGNGIVIPAHSSHCINAKEQFKMISTIIKSAYDN